MEQLAVLATMLKVIVAAERKLGNFCSNIHIDMFALHDISARFKALEGTSKPKLCRDRGTHQQHGKVW